MQRFGSQHDNGSQTLLRLDRNQIHTTVPLILDKGRRKRLVLLRSEVVGQFVNTLTADYQYSSLESGEFMATSFKADILQSECFF